MIDTIVQRNYKDTMFRMLFSEKQNVLSLYNALNGTSYTDLTGLEITTLENAVYMNYKNDISFVFDSELVLYEHQSTVNVNLPLRDLIYMTRVLQGITKNENLYGSRLVRIPTPRFIVFYNGTAEQPEQQILKLSDAFEKQAISSDLELIVTVYNINFGHNIQLMESCQVLKEYAQYVQKVRENAKVMAFTDAVESAVDYCIRKGILSDFLTRNRAEAIEMSIFEYNEELHIKSEKELSFQEGCKFGMEQGIKIGTERFNRLDMLNKRLLEENRIEALKRSIEDEEYRHKLYEEYNI